MNIGIIGAFDEEVEKFIEVFHLVKDDSHIWDFYRIFSLGGSCCSYFFAWMLQNACCLQR